jgi:hypothetical protein
MRAGPATKVRRAGDRQSEPDELLTGSVHKRHAVRTNKQFWKPNNGAQVNRSRRGGRKPKYSGGGGGGGNNGGGYNPNRTFDSSGPEVKIRGAASHVYEKYLQLARDANSSGDRVMAENYLQHAEHYYRIMAATAAQQAQNRAAAQPPAESQPPVNQPQETSAPSFSLSENESEDQGEQAEAS